MMATFAPESWCKNGESCDGIGHLSGKIMLDFGHRSRITCTQWIGRQIRDPSYELLP